MVNSTLLPSIFSPYSLNSNRPLRKIWELWFGGIKGHLCYLTRAEWVTLQIWLECLQAHESYALHKLSWVSWKILLTCWIKWYFLIYLMSFENLWNGLENFKIHKPMNNSLYSSHNKTKKLLVVFVHNTAFAP